MVRPQVPILQIYSYMGSYCRRQDGLRLPRLRAQVAVTTPTTSPPRTCANCGYTCVTTVTCGQMQVFLSAVARQKGVVGTLHYYIKTDTLTLPKVIDLVEVLSTVRAACRCRPCVPTSSPPPTPFSTIFGRSPQEVAPRFFGAFKSLETIFSSTPKILKAGRDLCIRDVSGGESWSR